MTKTLHLLFSLPFLAALAGCCANGSCNCQDELADALYFRINYTKKRQYDNSNPKRPISFNAKDIDTLRVYRTTRRPSNPRDTVGFVSTTDVVTIPRQLDTTTSTGDTLIKTTIESNGRTLIDQELIVLNNASPFASNGSAKLSGYNYRIAVVKNRVEIANYYILRPQLQGRYDANGCCTCYQNTGKTYTLGTQVLSDSVRVTASDSSNLRRVVRLRY